MEDQAGNTTPSQEANSEASQGNDLSQLSVEQRKNRAQERIQGLVAEKKQIFADLQAERAAKADILDKLERLEQKISSIEAKPTSQGTLDKYGTEDLWSLQATYMDKENEHYSPAMAVKVSQEILKRETSAIENKIRGEITQKDQIASENQRVFNDTLAMLGESAQELNNKNSPLYRLASQRYEELQKSYDKKGVDIRKFPEFQRTAILEAQAQLRAQGLTQETNREADQLRQKMKTKEALSAEGEAAVEELSERNSRLARGDVKGAFAKLSLIQSAADEVNSWKRVKR